MKANRTLLLSELKTKRHNTEDTVLIEEDDQERELTEAAMECYHKLENAIDFDSRIHCPVIFDLITCWPQATINETIYLPCADYVNKFNTKRIFF